ncbi:MAG: 4Fe-4S dicluster domain-containing protein [Syntrophales bacterium]|jgi:formate hydrogenlyase subunit 6/NADH:ubiquinone oxidoreductase subunit I
MGDNKAYLQLIEKQKKWIYGLPDSKYLLPLMKLRMTAEEAEFLLKIPHFPSTLEQLQEATNMDINALRASLDTLAGRGLVMKITSSKGSRYSLHDAFFWFYRMPGYAGKTDDFNKKISPLLNKYYDESMASIVHSHTHKGLRTIPINNALEDSQMIMPYEDTAAIIDASRIVCVSTCSCRHRKNLDPDEENCKHPTRTCLHFDIMGRYLIENGLAEEITKQEAHEIAQSCAGEGLVHAASNTLTGIDTICNCCSCCCAFISAEFHLPDQMARGHQRSNYIAYLDQEKCKQCGLCAKRCPMKALEVVQIDDKQKEVVLSPAACIGCGVCAHKCPTGAIRLQQRDKKEAYPGNLIELVQQMLSDQGVM